MELVHTQSLVDVKNKEIESEEHLKQVAERQSGRLKNEIEKLEQWALAARQKEEDNLTLEKYRRADEAKIKELTLNIEKLTIEVARKAKELE